MVRARFDPGAKMKRLGANLDRPTAALKQIGAVLVASSQKAFKEQKHGDVRWKPRAVPNVYGIIADFAKGRASPPKRRFDATPALIDTGHLRGSLAFRVIGATEVEEGSTVPYAATHQFGGPIKSERITKDIQRALSKWLKGRGKQWRGDLGFLLNRKFTGTRLQGTVEARPFVGLTKQDTDDIHRMIGIHVMEVEDGSR